jgi:hypothetical protein
MSQNKDGLGLLQEESYRPGAVRDEAQRRINILAANF